MATRHQRDRDTVSGNGATGADGIPVSDLLRQLAADASDLVRGEIALAKLETREMVREMALDTARLAAAIGLALLGGLVLLAAAVVALANLLGGGGWHYALSALIIGGIMLLVGGLLARSGMAGLKNPPKPEQTVRSVQSTRDWASREVREFKEEIRSQ